MVDVTAPIRLVLVDDDPLVRAGLSLILGGAEGIDIVGQAADGQEAVDVVAELAPDVVLMDIRMPVRDGLSATAAIVAAPAPPRVVVLTTFDNDQMVVRALRAGAAGFLLKDAPPQRLVDAVRAAAAGEPVLSPRIAAQLIAAAASDGRAREDDARVRARERLSALTDRELEVARAVGKGQSNAEIAAELFMSIATVKAHVGRALTKIAGDNRVQLAILVHDADFD
ncbi:response regulator transcription factor [Microbacterium sp. W1N]|uniref:response regulator n=1 Tax=Microbacterium festucae TaxID=2977531 RepID=UPI0021C031D3|nr:response regulator transcription factor [Microbacterium festucae]MCT9821269.1 response regulator transcription factor [Microbacterium festucae]